MLQKVVLAPQRFAIQRPRRRIQDLIGTEGLQHEIRDPCPQGLDRRVQIRIGRDQDRIGIEPDPPLLGQPIEARLPRHDIVEDHQVKMRLVQNGCRLGGGPRLLHPFAARRQDLGQKIAHPRLVINHQDRRKPEIFAIVIGTGM